MIQELKVNPTIGSSYSIYIQKELNFSKIIDFITNKQVLIISNPTVANIYIENLEKVIKPFCIQLEKHLIGDGEKYKSLDSLNDIYQKLLNLKYTRSSTVVIALGGGVVGDITGFASSTYQRGVEFIQIPTTLLSQVDSSVGGKTAVNHPLGKNMIGAFYQPITVLTSPEFFTTLPKREFIAGMAEVVKYACITNCGFFEWLENNSEKIIAKDNEILIEIIRKSCEIKAQIVANDELDITGQRALLNFGHTFGHAIEKCQNYEGLKHGEAVGVGIAMILEFSQMLNLTKNTQNIKRILNLLNKFSIPTSLPKNINQKEFLNAILLDKKNTNSDIKFILFNDIGNVFLEKVSIEKIIKYLNT